MLFNASVLLITSQVALIWLLPLKHLCTYIKGNQSNMHINYSVTVKRSCKIIVYITVRDLFLSSWYMHPFNNCCYLTFYSIFFFITEFRSSQGQSKLFPQSFTWKGKAKWREPKMPQSVRHGAAGSVVYTVQVEKGLQSFWRVRYLWQPLTQWLIFKISILIFWHILAFALICEDLWCHNLRTMIVH